MDPSRPISFTTRPESVVYAFFAVCFVGLGLFGAMEPAAGDFLPFGLLRLAVAWSIAAFLGLRMARLGVLIEENGIRVRNPLRTRRIPWRAVRGFVLSRSLFGEFGVAELHDGQRIRLWGIQPRSRVASPRDRRAEMAIGSLNHELQVARGYGSVRSGSHQPAAPLAPAAPSPKHT